MTEEDKIKETALRIYNSKISPLRFLIKSNVSMRVVPRKWWRFW
jgi:hypothetical protein